MAGKRSKDGHLKRCLLLSACTFSDIQVISEDLLRRISHYYSTLDQKSQATQHFVMLSVIQPFRRQCKMVNTADILILTGSNSTGRPTSIKLLIMSHLSVREKQHNDMSQKLVRLNQVYCNTCAFLARTDKNICCEKQVLVHGVRCKDEQQPTQQRAQQTQIRLTSMLGKTTAQWKKTQFIPSKIKNYERQAN